nr:MepB family protein [Flavobacterium sp. J27]
MDYGACTFELNDKKIQHRVAKITPTKVGQFVTIWKRNQQGITEPYHVTDALDFIFITTIENEKIGQFIFPKSVLAENAIISSDQKEGKRGIRVYPPWGEVTSKQALKTQSWQTKYFVTIRENKIDNATLLTQLIPKIGQE